MLYVRFPLSLRQVEDLLNERGIDVSYETVRYWWNRFGPLFAAEIRKRRIRHGSYSLWRWHLDEVFVRINGETCYLWRAVDHEGEVLEVYATKRRDREAALKFLRRTMKRYGRPASIVTDRLRSYRAAMKVIGLCQTKSAWSSRPVPIGRFQDAKTCFVWLRPDKRGRRSWLNNEKILTYDFSLTMPRQETRRWLNNRAENSHQPFRRRERAMDKFREVRTLQKFASVHASIHNHFNHQRHLNRRDIFKQTRAAALAEWRQLAA